MRIHQVIVTMRPGIVHSEGIEDKLCAPDPVTSRSLNLREFPEWIIELEADSGLIRLGEPRRADLYGPLRERADLIIGKELIDLPISNLPLPHADYYDSYFIYEAYEMAWLDLLGKHLGVPVHHLLGGKKINGVPVDFWMGHGTLENTAARAQTGLDLGFRGMKMKCVLGDGQELIVLLRMGFYGSPHYGTPIVTEQAMVDSVRADAGAHATGFYNYAEAPARYVD